ncbi:glycosyltransferase [Hallella sp.]|uniref:glycosyltransferase n=1 Tax=Hallella sp. TaxID=2980186 RepID=UPI003078F9C9
MNYYIINNASRAATYGIGTYVRQLTLALMNISSLNLYFIDLFAERKEFTVEKDESGLTHYIIPMNSSNIEDENYCRMAYYLIFPYITGNNSKIFHFNYFQHYSLALLLKAQNIHNKIFFSTHYLSWCFELNGDVSAFRKILNAKNVDDRSRKILNVVSQNKHFFHLADKIIVLSNFCKNLLHSDYNIPLKKIELVYNGLEDNSRTCYSTAKNKPTILYVGRLDKIKGVDYLIKAFRNVLKRHPDANLILIGDGDYNECLKYCKGIWDRVTFTGKISNEELEEFYQQTTIGALPSFHEQCSYSAIEFMMHGIPFVGTDSTGLSEMLDCAPNLRVQIPETGDLENEFTINLANTICNLIENKTTRNIASELMKKQFQERYTLDEMKNRLSALIVSSEQPNNAMPLAESFLLEIDDFMISLIHDETDIDTNLYGMEGIAVYLWWRLKQLSLKGAEGQSYKIKEYLIYYFDWFYKIINSLQNKVYGQEFVTTLHEIHQAGFYKTKVEALMSLIHYSSKPRKEYCIPTTDILQNSMRMFVTKI